jgi:N-acetylglucosamine-6-phosphate deacetylase
VGSLLLFGGKVLTPQGLISDGAVLAREGLIEFAGRRSDLGAVAADKRLDVDGRLVCPGFIDIQVNGGGGALLTEEPSVEAIERITRAHARFGTTSLLPTIVTAPEPRLKECLLAVRRAIARPITGARVLGAHLEGPFINPKKRGAHDERFIRAPDVELFRRLLQVADGALNVITLAPELPGSEELIGLARRSGVIASIGHTDATYDEATRGIDAGATLATHVFNAMRPLAQRDPGVIAALLESDRVTTGLIADGIHVHPAVLSLVARAKGPERTVLVTDAMPPVGASGEDGFALEGRRIEVRDGACYTKEGVLAGSALSMNRAIEQMSLAAGCSLVDAIRMATEAPAEVLGMKGKIGVLAKGARADAVICSERLEIWKTIVSGVPIYEA